MVGAHNSYIVPYIVVIETVVASGDRLCSARPMGNFSMAKIAADDPTLLTKRLAGQAPSSGILVVGIHQHKRELFVNIVASLTV